MALSAKEGMAASPAAALSAEDALVVSKLEEGIDRYLATQWDGVEGLTVPIESITVRALAELMNRYSAQGWSVFVTPQRRVEAGSVPSATAKMAYNFRLAMPWSALVLESPPHGN